MQRVSGSPWVLVCCFTLALSRTPAFGAEGLPKSEGDARDPVIAKASESLFKDLARLPTRLTIFNSHDDAARATYTCCRPDQEKEMERALKANEAFLVMYPRSDYADDALYHDVRIYSIQLNFRKQLERYARIINEYPHSDLADDAMWQISRLHCQDRDHTTEITYLRRLLSLHPASSLADDAANQLAVELTRAGDHDGALAAFDRLVNAYPYSESAANAVWQLASRYRQASNHERAMEFFDLLAKRYPYNDLADNAAFEIAQCYRSLQQVDVAVRVCQDLVDRFPASEFARQAANEVNAVAPGSIKAPSTYPHDEAKELFQRAQHRQNYREFTAAANDYLAVATRFPGTDQADDALFQAGRCLREMNRLFVQVNKAQGPEDFFRLRPDVHIATGSGSVARGMQSASDAVSAFLTVARSAPGSPLRDDAFWEAASCYRDMEMHAQEAFTWQQLLMEMPGSDHESEALYRMLKFYADPKHYPNCLAGYRFLTRAFPDLFPAWVTQTREDYLALMGAYSRIAEHAWDELHLHHIPYTLGPSDLTDDGLYIQAALAARRGDFRGAISRLDRLVRALPLADLAGPAAFMMGRLNEHLGGKQRAAQLYALVQARYATGGLGDDAEKALRDQNNTGDHLLAVKTAEDLQEKLQLPVTTMDCYVGRYIVVYAPYTISMRLREYNMPNIWDAAYDNLSQWTGSKPTAERKVIVLDGSIDAPKAGDPILLPATAVGDPPDWHLGLWELAIDFLRQPQWTALMEVHGSLPDAFARVAAGALQYNLVSETRDTIGSASAVKLAHEDVIRARKAATDALQKYVQDGAQWKSLNPEAAAGMLIALLDANGFGKDELIDWAPYARFFKTLAATPEVERTGPGSAKAVARCLNEAFNGDVSGHLKAWGYPAPAGKAVAQH